MTSDTPRPATLTELAVRAANGSGEDRELDAEIAIELFDGGADHLDDPRDVTRARKVLISHGARPGNFEVVGFSGVSLRAAPAFTTSVDAVLSIMPEGTFWQVGHDGLGPDPSQFAGRVGIPDAGGPGLTFRRAIALDAPRALLFALLLALAEIERVKGEVL